MISIKLTSYFEKLERYFKTKEAIMTNPDRWIIKEDERGNKNIFLRNLIKSDLINEMSYDEALKWTQNTGEHQFSVGFYIPAHKGFYNILPNKYKDWDIKLLVNREWDSQKLLNKDAVVSHHGEPYAIIVAKLGANNINFNIQPIKNLCGAVTISGWNWGDDGKTGYDLIKKIIKVMGFGGFFYHVADHQTALLDQFSKATDAKKLGSFKNPRTGATITTFFVNV